ENGEVMSDQTVPDAPARTATILADWQFVPRWHVAPQINWVADRERPEGDLRDNVDDYTTVDVSFTADDILAKLDLSLGVRNLFDKKRWEPISNSSMINPDGAY